jgi:hypothetical protein
LVSVVLLAVGGCWNGDTGGGPVSRPEETQQALRSGPDVKYVSPDGSDATDAKGTKRDPWRTLRYALPKLNPGQLLYVRDGTYREDLRRMVLNPGLADEGIVVQAYPGERALVRGLVWLRQPSYWTFDGLDVTWDKKLADSPPHMVKITGGVGWTWTNSEIWGAEAASNVLITGWQASEPADWEFVGNCVHSLVGSDTVVRGSNLTVGDMPDGAGPGAIERNLFFDVEAGRNLLLGRNRGPDTGGPVDVLVRWNTFYDSDTAIALAGETREVRIERNILGGVSTRTLVRSRRLDNLEGQERAKVQQNLGIASEDPKADEQLFFQEADAGDLSPNRAGNTIVDYDYVDFDDTTSCGGFNSTESVVLPYGRDAIG